MPSLLPMFSSRSWIISYAQIFNLFGFIFVYGRGSSPVSFLGKLNSHMLTFIEETALSPLYILEFCHKLLDHVCMVYFWALYSVPQICF